MFFVDQLSNETTETGGNSLSEEPQSNSSSGTAQSQANFHWGQMVYG